MLRWIWRLARGAFAGGDVLFVPHQHGALIVHGRVSRLRPQESRVLQLLIEARGQPVSREVLQNALWPDVDKSPEWIEADLHHIIGRLRSLLRGAIVEIPRETPRRGAQAQWRLRGLYELEQFTDAP